MISVTKIFAPVVLASAITVACAAGAEATPIDLTVFTADITYDGTNFFAQSVLHPDPSDPYDVACPLGQSTCSGISWTGTAPDTSIGVFTFNWQPTTSNFSFSLIDLLGNSGVPAGSTLLAGTVTSFAQSLLNPGVFAATLAFSTTNLGFGNFANVSFSSFDFSGSAGTADVDITAVPEPATLSLVGLGAAIMAARRRRAKRRVDFGVAT
jgi:hypothetical protein